MDSGQEVSNLYGTFTRNAKRANLPYLGTWCEVMSTTVQHCLSGMIFYEWSVRVLLRRYIAENYELLLITNLSTVTIYVAHDVIESNTVMS